MPLSRSLKAAAMRLFRHVVNSLFRIRAPIAVKIRVATACTGYRSCSGDRLHITPKFFSS
jgi:hypothetical protein